MNRLTTKTSIMGNKHDLLYGRAYIWKEKLKDLNYPVIEKAIDKLGQLENIEEALEIDLITLFDIYNKLNTQKSIYIKLGNEIREEPLYTCHFVIDFISRAFRELDYDSDCLYFIDYGKTWALTREELKEAI